MINPKNYSDSRVSVSKPVGETSADYLRSSSNQISNSNLGGSTSSLGYSGNMQGSNQFQQGITSSPQNRVPNSSNSSYGPATGGLQGTNQGYMASNNPNQYGSNLDQNLHTANMPRGSFQMNSSNHGRDIGNISNAITEQIYVAGNSNYDGLRNMKNLLGDLIQEFNGNKKLMFEGNQGEDYSKRLLMLERDLDGFMKRFEQSGGKNLDYGKLLQEKENLLHEKEGRLQNITEKLRRVTQHDSQLDIEVKRLTQLLNERNKMVQDLRRQNQLYAEGIDKVGASKSGVSGLDDLFHAIKSYKDSDFERFHGQDAKTYLAQLDKDLHKLKSKSTTLPELEQTIEAFILTLPANNVLREKLTKGQLRLTQDSKYRDMQEKLSLASDIYKQQIEQLKKDNPNARISADTRVFDLLRSHCTRAVIINNIVEIEKEVVVTREVPAQDTRSRELLRLLRTHLIKMHEKYPKLKSQIDVNLGEFLDKGIIEGLEGDSMDRIVDIVRYVPQVVKVENIYRESTSAGNRKVEFHLRVLIKALLDQMERVRRAKGISFDLDDGVVGMAHAQINDLNDIGDIINVYRSAPRIIQVERVVEKVIDNIVRVPEKIALNQFDSKTVDMQKPYIAVDEKAVFLENQVGVALYREKAVEVPSTREKIVFHPETQERVSIETHEKTRLQPMEQYHERIIQVEKPVMVTEEKIVIQKELQVVEVIKEMPRYIESTNQVLKPVEVLVEKIVEKIIEREKIVQVPTVIEKIIEVVRYEKAPEMVPYVETRVQIVKEIVEKIVPVIHYEERIVTVPQIVEKIVTVEKIVNQPPIEVEVIREVLRVVKEIQVVQVEVPKIIIQKEIEIREIEKYIQVPIVVPQVRIQTEIHQIPLIETIERETHIPIEVLKHVVITEEKPVEVIRNVPYIMREEVPIIMREERIIPVDMYFERIKEVITVREKIVEKLVEVPKCVQIQKIVQKIVVVPRIIEKIVEVPQIIQKIVEKIVQFPVQMPPVEHFIEKQVRVEVPVEVYRDRIVYVTVDRPVEIPANTILVVDKEVKTEVKVETLIEERVRIHKEEIPVQIYVDKIVAYPVPTAEVHYVDKVIVKPIQVPVPVMLEQTKPVYVNTESVRVEPVPHLVEKVVERVVTQVQPQIINQIQEKVVVEQKYKFEEVQKVYIEKHIEKVDVIHEKIVEVKTIVEQLKEVPYMIEKLVPVVQQIPKVYEYEKEARVIYTPPTIEIVDRIVPRIINVNKYVEKIVEKLVEVPHLLRQIEIVKEMHEKKVPGPQNTDTALKTVDLKVEVEMIREKQRIVTEKVNIIEQVLQVVSEVLERERDPVIITRDRIIEVPHVVEKIVEKVILMPQIVEVLKYVHEIFDNQGTGDMLSASLDIGVQAADYKRLGQELEVNLGDFLLELGKIKSLQPNSATRISNLEDYLQKFRRFIKFPKIHEIIKEKIVEKDKFVKVQSSKTPTDTKQELAKSMLIEKLISQITRIKKSNPGMKFELDEELKFIFGLEFDGKVKDLNQKLNNQLKDFEQSLHRKFSSMGGWSLEHQEMLNTFLEERFVLASMCKNTNQQLKQLKKQNDQLNRSLNDSRDSVDRLMKVVDDYKKMVPSIMKILEKQDHALAQNFNNIMIQIIEITTLIERTTVINTHTEIHSRMFIEDPSISNGNYSNALREKQSQIELLRSQVRNSKTRSNDHAHCTANIESLEQEITRLNKKLDEIGGSQAQQKDRNVIRNLEMDVDKLNRQLAEYVSNSSILQNKNRNLEEEISRLNKATKIASSSGHDQCAITIRGLENDLQRAKLESEKLRATANNHDSCNTAKHQLKSDAERKDVQIRKLKEEIRSYLARLNNAETEIKSLKIQGVAFSPKQSVGTKNSVTSPSEGKRISHLSKDKEGDYGSNYFEYINSDSNFVGTVDADKPTYSSTHFSSSTNPFNAQTTLNKIANRVSIMNDDKPLTPPNNPSNSQHNSQHNAPTYTPTSYGSYGNQQSGYKGSNQANFHDVDHESNATGGFNNATGGFSNAPGYNLANSNSSGNAGSSSGGFGTNSYSNANVKRSSQVTIQQTNQGNIIGAEGTASGVRASISGAGGASLSGTSGAQGNYGTNSTLRTSGMQGFNGLQGSSAGLQGSSAGLQGSSAGNSSPSNYQISKSANKTSLPVATEGNHIGYNNQVSNSTTTMTKITSVSNLQPIVSKQTITSSQVSSKTISDIASNKAMAMQMLIGGGVLPTPAIKSSQQGWRQSNSYERKEY